MSQLRALTLGVGIVLIFGTAAQTPALAMQQTVSTSTVVQNTNGQATSLADGARTGSIRQTLQYGIAEIVRGTDVSVALTRVVPDYSSYFVTRKGGARIPLSELGPQKTELTGGVNASWASGAHSAGASWNGSLGESPFAFQEIKAWVGESFLNRATSVFIGLEAAREKQPDSLYVGVDQVTRQRPTELRRIGWEARIEQALSERWKTELALVTNQREEDRPRNVGVKFGQAFALSERIYSILTLERTAELQREALKDERGYFSLSSAALEFGAEPWVDFLVASSYEYVLEGEADPRTGRSVQVGSDQFGAGFSYRIGSWSFTSRAGYRVSNTGLRALNWEGGVAWSL